jgi:mono/diheme cytochrome c family protein
LFAGNGSPLFAGEGARATFPIGATLLTISNFGFKAAVIAMATLLPGVVPSLFAQSKSTSAGESLFKSHCVMCHGSDGAGNTTMGKQLKAQNLHSKEVQKLTEVEIKNVILNGKGNMPPFDGQVSSDEAGQIAHYVHTLSKMK